MRRVGPEGGSTRRPAAKRAFDLLLAVPALLLLAPVLALVALLVLLTLGRPVLFRQARPGFGGRPFRILKFRTMNDLRGPDGALLPDAERLTRLGRLLRRTSLDELPELCNVVKGEMSLVGPRPLLTCYLDRYSSEQRRRHEMLPGITGLAQVSGRNAISWEEKFRLDVWYVDNWSLWLDLRILAVTAWKALNGYGVSRPGFATETEFLGSAEPPAVAPAGLTHA